MNKISEDVLSLQLALERAWPRGGSSVPSERLLERLEAENAQLQSSVVDLMLQIQALHDALGHPQIFSILG